MNFPLVSLSDVTTVIAGQSPPGNTYNDSGIGLPFFQGKTDFGETHPIARKWCTAPQKTAKCGDILISVRAPVGPTNVADSHCCIGRGLAAIHPDETVVLRDFILWNLKHRETELVAMGQGSTFSAISQKNLKSLQIPLPPLNEQRRIVNILNRAAKIERLRKQAQERLQEFIPALFIKMFGDPADNPMRWPCSLLGEVCDIVGGGTPRRNNQAYFGGPIPWATPTDVTALSDIFIEKTAETITEKGLQESSARLVPAGTVLLTSRATIGFTAIAVREMTTNQGFANLIYGNRLAPEYLAIWLRLQRDQLIHLAGGSTFKEIPKSTLKKLEIPIPPIDTQRRFASLAVRTNSNLTTATTAQSTTTALSNSLMSHLLEAGA